MLSDLLITIMLILTGVLKAHHPLLLVDQIILLMVERMPYLVEN